MQTKIGHARRTQLWCIAISLLVISWSLLHLTMHNSSTPLFSASALVSMLVNRPSPVPNAPTPPLESAHEDVIPVTHKPKSANFSADRPKLKVYMYDMPPMFHFGLLGWEPVGDHRWPDVNKIEEIPRYPGGLNLQHSVEYWLALDLLSSNRTGVAVRAENSISADAVFVPFFSSLSYNRYSKVRSKDGISMNKFLQIELVKFLKGREEWKRSGGKDHVIVAHHPNSLLDARQKLKPSMFVLADFGRYPSHVANVRKDVIAPYRHIVEGVGNRSAMFDKRPILAYFQGAIHRKDGGSIREKLYHLLKDEKDVHFTYGAARGHGTNPAGVGMASSKFCLNIAGDTPSSNRLFDAIVSHCVPVIISDEIELPFEDVLDYTEFCFFIRSVDAVKKGHLVKFLRGIRRNEWTGMWERLKQVAHHFEYQYPSQRGDAVQMIWEAIARKVTFASSPLNREKRLRKTQLVHRRY